MSISRFPIAGSPDKLADLTDVDTTAAAVGQVVAVSQVSPLTFDLRHSPTVYNVRDFGAVGDDVADDTAAIQAALDAARMQGVRRGGTVFLPAGRYRITAPLRFYVAVSVIGEGWSQDSTFYNVSAIRAASTFVGTAMLWLDADGNTVSDPDPRPDRSWHWGVIEKLMIRGNGKTGPHGIDPGWNGEATSIRNVSILNANSGIYLTSTQAACSLDTVSIFDCAIALNCDNIAGTVRAYALSGDNNDRMIRVKGGRATNVTIYGLKSESYDVGTGDPLIVLEDLLGGAFTLVGGWVDTNAARAAVIQINQPSGSSQRPRITLIGFDHNDLWTNLIDDTFDGRVVDGHYGNLGYPLVTYNSDHGVLGAGVLGIGYGRSITGTQFGGAATMPLISSGADNGVVVHAGVGASGGRLMDSTYVHTLMQWRKNGANNIGFYGVEPVVRAAAPTAADASTVDATYGTEEAAVINNLRTRLGQMETALRNLGLIT